LLTPISERCVQRALSATQPDRTILLVAHRLSTLLDTDRILVFDQGQIVESGTCDELVRRGGVFTELLRHAQEGAHGSPNGSAEAAPEPQPAPAAGAA
jgi:ATP-binding cassette subfamily B protein